MRKMLFFSLLTLSIFATSCKKDPIKAIFGKYAGQRTTIETGQREVFTSPTQSFLEAFTTTTIVVDTIEISETGNGEFIPDPFPFLQASYSALAATEDTLRYSFSLLGGAIHEECDLHFNTDEKTFYFKGFSTETSSSGSFSRFDHTYLGKKL